MRLTTASLLREAVQRRASDIHLEPGPDGHRARLRVGGVLVDALGGATLPTRAVQKLAERCGLRLNKPGLGALDEGPVRFRAAALSTERGLLLSLHRPGELRADVGALGMLEPERQRVEQALLGRG